LFIDMDGTFPNHHPDPTVEVNLAHLKAAVAEHGADVGIAFDGDADRIGAVDHRGQVVWGDQLLLFFARELLRNHPGATIVSEVKCSRVLFDGVEAAGGTAEMWKVGHSLIKARMKETGALLAGEMSGHIFFADRYFGFDDAVYVGGRLLELLAHSDERLADMLDGLPHTVTTPELRVACPDAAKFEVVERAVAWFRARYSVSDLDGVRVNFPHGWGLVRASNTQPVLVMRFEADTDAHLAEYRGEVENWLRAHAPEVDLEADTHH
jgi:phosphomannomutase/phosphoglucomutase